MFWRMKTFTFSFMLLFFHGLESWFPTSFMDHEVEL
jgi:hypothetical protein